MNEMREMDRLNVAEDGEILDSPNLLNRIIEQQQVGAHPYQTAQEVDKARDLKQARRRLMDEATLAGEDFYYGWGAGKNRVEGPSVNLALAAARCWGNCAIEIKPVQPMEDCWIFTACFIDLETGFTLSRQFRQAKDWVVHGQMDNARKDDVRFQIGQSKAIRNVILNALPPSLVRQAMEEAKQGVRSKIEQFVKSKGEGGLVIAVDMVIKALAKCGVKEAQVLGKCGVADRKGINLDHLVMLRGDLSAIENGQDRAETLYPSAEGQGNNGGGKTAADVAGKLAAGKDRPSRATLQQLKQTLEQSELPAAIQEEVERRLTEAGAGRVEQLNREQADALLVWLLEARKQAEASAAAERKPGED